MSKIGAGFAIAVCFFVAGCGGVGAAEAGVPAINQILPQTVAAGSGNTTVQIVGSHISDATVVLWNGSPLSTTLVNDTTVATPVESANLASPGTAELQLMNSVTGVKSAAVEFNISGAAKNAPALAIMTTSLPSGTVGSGYSATLTATGGTTPYSWSFTSGRMPAGLALDASGIISGTPTAAGTYSVGLTVKDRSKPAQQKFIALTLIVAPGAVSRLGVTTTSLPAATYAASYSQTLQATGGTPSYGWVISSGSLPPGLSLNSTGVISGRATTRGSFPFTATANDSGYPQQSANASLSITVTETPISISTKSLAAGTAGTAYSQTLSATGGAAPYAWSVASGSLPPGVSLSAGGSLTGTPAASGTFAFTASVSDASNPVQTQAAAFSIAISASPLKINTSSLTGDTVGAAYSQTLAASGGTAPYTWSILSGSLPPGLSFSTAGSLTGAPSASGTFTFTASVSDKSNPVQTQSIPLSIAVSPVPLKISATSLAQGIFGRPYAGALQATGGTPGYSWSLTSGSLPAGLTLNNATGAISGTPAASGTATFTTIVNDNGSPAQTASALVSISIAPAPLTITASTLPSVNVSSAYSQTLQATGGTAPYQWSIRSGSLPAGLTLSSATGTISGTPSAAGTTTFTANVTDSSNPVQAASVVFSIVVNPSQSTLASPKPLSILAPASSSGTAGSAYSQTLGVTGGTSPYSWSIAAGSLPAGLTLSPSGTISGTLMSGSSGSYGVTVSVSDSESPVQSVSATMTITVNAAAASPLQIVSSTLGSGTTGSAYAQAFQATGGTPAYAWSVTSGSLPSGLSLSSSGVVSGTPSVAGTSTFTATVSDSGSPAQSQSVSASINITAAQASNGTIWYVRPDGGTRYDANVPNGQCNGKSDAPYPGSGVNQNCAFNDFRYMWDDGSGMVGAGAWIIAGGDTVLIRGCSALPGQVNASNPDCRLGWDAPTGNAPNRWCYAVGSYTCYNPPIPAGTSTQHTRILGQNYANCALNGATNPQLYTQNLTQLFGGFSLFWTFNLENTQYVDIQCIELTTHNGQCTSSGSPSYPRPCNNNQPLDDYALNGFWFNNASSNISLQDVYVHGFNSSGFDGPIGGPVSLTRVFSGFNAFAGWNFDDGRDTPDAAGSQILASYVTMVGNGCYEEYPIVHTQFPARACYDDVSSGFGDAWSGQDTELDVFTCDHCVTAYNTKDAFIGPHTNIEQLTITNSQSYGNMGAQWKWNNAPGATVKFLNNLSIGNCARFADAATPIPGAAHVFGKASGLGGAYLSDYCRAGGNLTASNTQQNSTVLFANNTYVESTDSSAHIFLGCGPASQDRAGNCNTTTVTAVNNIFLGYPVSGGQKAPVAFETDDPSVTFTPSYNIYFGDAGDPWSKCGTSGQICSDPLLVNEPPQAAYSYTAQSFLDNFNFHPSILSPALGAGTTYTTMLLADYYGIARLLPSTIGAVQQ